MRGHTFWEPPIALAAFIVAALGAIVYWPSIHGGFIFDDEALLTANEIVRATDGLYRIWLTTEPHDYWPVTNTAFWLEWRVWGTDPTGYHMINVMLHLANTLLAWRLLRIAGVRAAFLAALIFLVHPVNVESVAWIAQRKNTLSMFFLLLSAWFYLRPTSVRSRSFLLSFLAFALAMLSKGSAVVLPPLLLLTVWWRDGVLRRGDLLRTAPFFALGAALTVVNIWFQTHGGEVIRQATLVERTLGAGAILLFYWVKAVLPFGLSFIYPLWQINPVDIRWWLPDALCIAVTIFLFWNRSRPWARSVLFAWLFVAIALIPVLGFTDVYFMKFSLVADHYQYISILGVAGLIAATVERVLTAKRARQ